MIINPDVTRVPLAIERSQSKEMLTITKVGGQTHVRVNYSSLSVMQECPRKSFYQFEMGLKSRTEGPATIFGNAIHKALEVFYIEPREGRNIPPNFKEHSDLMAHGHDAPLDHFLYRSVKAFVDYGQPLKPLPDTDKRSLWAGVWLLQNYFRNYISDPFVVFCDEAGPVIERRCEFVVYETPELKISLFGTLDAILRNDQTGVILPTDHKTSSIVGNDFYNRLKPNHQYSGYALLAKKSLGIEGDGFLVNCLQVKSRPLTTRGTPPDFPRQVTRRSEKDLAEFVDTLVAYVKQYLHWKELNLWPMGSVNVCTYFGGCPYLEVCGAPHEIRDAIIENKFVTTKGQQ